ncbi:putative NAD(P)-binding domain superfamily [Helianthus debilis subsp. tardiflorus]
MICGATVIAVARCLKGVGVLYDPVGGKLTKEGMKLLNPAAHILVIGFASGEVPIIPTNIALVKVNELLDSCL